MPFAINPYRSSMFSSSHPEFTQTDNLSSSLSVQSSVSSPSSSACSSPTSSKHHHFRHHQFYMEHLSPKRRLSKRRTRCNSTDSQASSVSLPASMQSFRSTSSAASKAKRLAQRLSLGGLFARRKSGASEKRKSIGMKAYGHVLPRRRPSTLDFRCIGAADDSYDGLMRASTWRLDILTRPIHVSFKGNVPPTVNWERPVVDEADWFSGVYFN